MACAYGGRGFLKPVATTWRISITGGPRFSLSSRPFLDMAVIIVSLKNLAQARYAEACTGEVDSHEPKADNISKVMQKIGICDTIDGR